MVYFRGKKYETVDDWRVTVQEAWEVLAGDYIAKLYCSIS